MIGICSLKLSKYLNLVKLPYTLILPKATPAKADKAIIEIKVTIKYKIPAEIKFLEIS